MMIASPSAILSLVRRRWVELFGSVFMQEN
jgi:hypothetical protein